MKPYPKSKNYDKMKNKKIKRLSGLQNAKYFFSNGYKEGFDAAMKACGGCLSCYGKGYATTIQYAKGRGETDMGQGDIVVNKQLPIMRFCRCERGKQLKLLTNKKSEE